MDADSLGAATGAALNSVSFEDNASQAIVEFAILPDSDLRAMGLNVGFRSSLRILFVLLVPFMPFLLTLLLMLLMVSRCLASGRTELLSWIVRRNIHRGATIGAWSCG